MFNLVLNHHCLHIAKGGGGQQRFTVGYQQGINKRF